MSVEKTCEHELNWLIDRCDESARALRSMSGAIDPVLKARRALSDELERVLHAQGGQRHPSSGLRALIGRTSARLSRLVHREGADEVAASDRALLSHYERACEASLPIVVADVLLRHHRFIKRETYRAEVA